MPSTRPRSGRAQIPNREIFWFLHALHWEPLERSLGLPNMDFLNGLCFFTMNTNIWMDDVRTTGFCGTNLKTTQKQMINSLSENYLKRFNVSPSIPRVKRARWVQKKILEVTKKIISLLFSEVLDEQFPRINIIHETFPEFSKIQHFTNSRFWF